MTRSMSSRWRSADDPWETDGDGGTEVVSGLFRDENHVHGQAPLRVETAITVGY